MHGKLLATGWRRKAEREDWMTGLPFAGLLLAGGIWNLPILFIPALGFFIVGFTLQRIRFRRWRCQKCGAVLRAMPRDGGPVSFACPGCDIIWTTGVHKDLQ